MGILRTKTIEPATGSTLTLGASGDTITVSSDSIKANTFKDAGGNTLFTSDGAGTLSSINSGLSGGGGPILITSYTSGGVSAHEIQSGIDDTYDEYMLVFNDYGPATDNVNFQFQASIDGGSNYNVAITSTAFEALHNEDGNGGALAYNTGDDQAQGTSYQNLCFDLGNGADESCAGILHLFNPASTTYVKHFYARFHGYHTSNYCIDNFVSGYFNTTSAINALQFKMTSGVHDGHYSMYGIK
jgi:hypothetical protein